MFLLLPQQQEQPVHINPRLHIALSLNLWYTHLLRQTLTINANSDYNKTNFVYNLCKLTSITISPFNVS